MLSRAAVRIRIASINLFISLIFLPFTVGSFGAIPHGRANALFDLTIAEAERAAHACGQDVRPPGVTLRRFLTSPEMDAAVDGLEIQFPSAATDRPAEMLSAHRPKY